MTQYHDVMPHGPIKEVLPNIFFVTGTMENEFFGSMWKFSRNMTIVRENNDLTIFNSVRLNDDGLAALDKLGRVVNVVRLGDMHGVDDRFYVDRYQAKFWALPDMTIEEGLQIDEALSADNLPVANSSLFVFDTVKRPECILRLDRDGGVMIACDSLQNWVAPDEFFSEETVETMQGMGFFTPANLGPAWMHGSEPQAEDFARLKEVPFEHAFCGHGEPVIGGAQRQYHETFARVFNV
jgi:hypothetical protein